MKKFLVFLCALGFLFGAVGTASAILFADTKSPGATFAEGLRSGLIYPSRFTYLNETPYEFRALPEVANNATLTISEYWTVGNDDKAGIEGLAAVSLIDGGNQVNRWQWRWDPQSITNFDTRNIFVFTLNAADSLDVPISAHGSWSVRKLELSSATFALDYTGTAAPFSEPVTMLLFGIGLIGLARFGRKKLSNKALGPKRLSFAHS